MRSKGRLPHGLQQARAPAVPPRRPLPACRAQAAHLPTFPPDETYPPSPNAPASQVPTLPRLLLPAWNTPPCFPHAGKARASAQGGSGLQTAEWVSHQAAPGRELPEGPG